jgi:hypothetical protein
MLGLKDHTTKDRSHKLNIQQKYILDAQKYTIYSGWQKVIYKVFRGQGANPCDPWKISDPCPLGVRGQTPDPGRLW